MRVESGQSMIPQLDVQRRKRACFVGSKNFWAQACKLERTSPQQGPRFFEWSGLFWPENDARRFIGSLATPDFLQHVVTFRDADLREKFDVEVRSAETQSVEIVAIALLKSKERFHQRMILFSEGLRSRNHFHVELSLDAAEEVPQCPEPSNFQAWDETGVQELDWRCRLVAETIRVQRAGEC
jgi:hypothetical protein